MDCGFNINHILPDEITLLDATADFWKNTSVGGGREFMRQQVCTVIDRIGEGSAQSQGFLTPITTSQKLRASDHRLYIMKDASANQFRGGVIGYIKVARKKLLIQNPQGQQQQYEPLCLLDFFVDLPYQRQGHGQKLMNFVLNREHVQPQDLAIDRPSPKCLSFFSHRYNLTDTVRQSTPFVVFVDFFNGNTTGRQPEVTRESQTANGPVQKTYNGFYTTPPNAPPTSINPGAGYKSDEMTTVNGDYGRTYNNGNRNGHNGAGQSDKPSPTENGGPGVAQTLTAELVKEKQERANVLQPKDAARSSLRPTKGANMHYNHTQLW